MLVSTIALSQLLLCSYVCAYVFVQRGAVNYFCGAICARRCCRPVQRRYFCLFYPGRFFFFFRDFFLWRIMHLFVFTQAISYVQHIPGSYFLYLSMAVTFLLVFFLLFSSFFSFRTIPYLFFVSLVVSFLRVSGTPLSARTSMSAR